MKQNLNINSQITEGLFRSILGLHFFKCFGDIFKDSDTNNLLLTLFD